LTVERLEERWVLSASTGIKNGAAIILTAAAPANPGLNQGHPAAGAQAPIMQQQGPVQGGFTITAIQGTNTDPHTVATFTEPSGPESPASYSANIAWGDGTTTSGDVSGSLGSTGILSVNGSHTYSATGIFTITVYVHRDNNPANDAIAQSTALVASTNGFVINGVDENQNTGLRQVAIFAPVDNDTNANDYAADIDWADGTAHTAGLIVFNPGAGDFTVFGSHTYSDEGAFIVNVNISFAGVLFNTVTDVAIISDPAVIATAGSTFTAPEGATSAGQVMATFTDPGGPEALIDYSADIVWGDGSTTPGTVAFNASTGVFTVTSQANHSYADEGNFSITVVIHHDIAPEQAITLSASVTEADVLSPTTMQPPLTATENGAFTGVVATFNDTLTTNIAGDFTATIDWGDGTTTDGTVSGSNGLFSVNGSHTYSEEGTFTIKATLTDKDDDGSGLATASAAATNSITVNDVPVDAIGGFTVVGAEGTLSDTQTVATFTDPAGAEALTNYSADIAWGDGMTTAGTTIQLGTDGVFTVSGSHNYADEGSYTLTVTIHHDTAADVSVTSTANISESDVLAASPTQPTIAPVEITPFTGPVAAFTDTYTGNTANDFTASIDWGDGTTTPGSVTGGNGSFTVNGMHTYMTAGSFTITTNLNEDGDGTASASITNTVDVANHAVVVAGGFTVSAVEGTAADNQTVATFTDPAGAESVSAYSADIDWGDGTTTSSGTISVDSSTGVFTVQGSHTYAEEGSYTITATVHHQTASPAMAMSNAAVADASLTAGLSVSISATEATAFNGRVASFTDANSGAPASDFTANIDWGDGTSSTGTVSANTSGGFDVTGSHSYVEDGNFTVTSVIHDVGGSSLTTTNTAQVAEAALVPNGLIFTDLEQTLLSNIVVGNFTHGDGTEPAANFQASIDWGDGMTSVGTVGPAQGQQAGTYQVTGTHTYADERSTPYTVTITVTDLSAQVAPTKITSSANIIEDFLLVDRPTTHNQRFLSEVYHDLLGRAIDGTGLQSWGALLDAGGTREQVVLGIESSMEYQIDQVQALYQRYLKRAADPTGLSGGVAFLESGGTVEGLAQSLILSPEYAARAGTTDTEFFNTVYMDTFGRPIDQKGLNDILTAMAAGQTRAQSVFNILHSEEYRMDLVSGFYFQFLDRLASQNEVNGWSAFLAQGNRDEVAVADIMGTMEYFDKTVLGP
jgi:hypothetical protein